MCAASRGLGRATAEALAREGCNIAICARNVEPLESAASYLRDSFDVDVLPIAADLTQPSQIDSMVAKVLERWGSIHILVTNAGGPPSGPFQNHSMEDWKQALDLNLLSTVLLCQIVVPPMKKQRWGRIIHITSASALQPLEGLILSSAARAGVLGFSKSLANELGPWNILVNCVCPGYTLTDRVVGLLKSKSERMGLTVAEACNQWESQIPLGRLGRPVELASVIAFLASEQASYVTGTAIAVDGGLVQKI